MMNTVKKFVRNLAMVTVTFAFLAFLSTSSAVALMNMPDVDSIFESIEIKDGAFDLQVAGNIPQKSRVGSAVVDLPDGETGTIKKIVITGPDGQREFGCENIDVKNGTDLILSCGGPAYLKAGKTTYIAKGSNFKPQGNVKLGVELSK